MSKTNKAYDAIVKARSWLIINHIFFGSLIMELKLREDQSFETMATDGKHLFYNPKFVLEQDEEHLIGELVHEIYHCIYKHHTRMKERDLLGWNMAGDYVINLEVTDSGFKLPDWVLLDDQYRHMSTEEVYNLIYKPEEQKLQPKSSEKLGEGKGSGNGNKDASNSPDNGDSDGQGGSGDQKPERGHDPGKCGGVIPSRPEWDKSGLEADDIEWSQKVQQAANVAKAQNAGDYPSYVKRVVDALDKPKFNWQAFLREYVGDSTTEIESWTNPDKRYLHSNLVLPGKLKNGVNHIVCAIDTSGSISQPLLKAYMSELQAFLDEGLCDKLTVLSADTKVHSYKEFESGDLLSGFMPEGGGGTSFRNTFKWISQRAYDATIILYFTDLIVHDFGDQPDVPVVWCIYGTEQQFNYVKDRPPFGECLSIRE